MEAMEQSFHCSSCNIFYSDLKYLLEHYETLEHADMIQEKAKESSIKNINEQNYSNRNNETSVNDDRIIINDEKSSWLQYIPSKKYDKSENASYSFCNICQKHFSGPEPYQQHIVSAAHIKKCASQNFTTGSNSPSSNINTLVCKMCVKSFSGPVPYQQHLNSEGHRKKENAEHLLRRLKETANKCDTDTKALLDSKLPYSYDVVRGEADTTTNINDLNKHTDKGINVSKADMPNTSVPPNWYCDTCKKQCTGPVPYQQHMSSEVHRKNLRRIEASQKMFENKIQNNETSDLDLPQEILTEKVNNYDEKSANSRVSNAIDMLSTNIVNFQNWYCKTCQKQCSGPIPFQQHMSGDVHRKNQAKAEITARLIGQQTYENKNSAISKSNLPSSQSESISMRNSTSLSQQAFLVEGVPKSLENKMENSACTLQLQTDYLLDDHELQNMTLLPENLNITFVATDEELDFDNQSKNNCQEAIFNAVLPNYMHKVTEIKENQEIDSMDFEIKEIEENLNMSPDMSNENNTKEIEQEIKSKSAKKEKEIEKASNSDIYEICTVCNVRLLTKELFIDHYESKEHFMKKWQKF